ncbi:hypothetical protein PHAVU_009G217200 [Phaseolus vulgaris]|uniref:RRM domain-containing protein n=1 Tax=Phaseolus vulgaris TaxID=3885 RepID=V7AY66_PHAVU|nr:hypothetical protein PHAVU_009G217200g [Phaseolus vulgaris]ESW10529.1 hypothetical protein PHAVU_009G217200g [Phaseolus vulgaris]
MAEEAEETINAVRIFVGGLAEAVSAEDLRSLFSSLGTVQAVQTIRTKGRSFAYIDFQSNPKSLSKLFSKYNGCLWKGGKLRLEKAKEDYLARMKREWEHDALDDATQPPPSSPKDTTGDSSKSNTKHLNIFFPRLRKVKTIPFSGTGKHKYSFQNIKVPPLPVHFCDCEEHCSPFVTEKGKLYINGAAERGGMNDEEISIMNAVMNKLLQKEKVSSAEKLGKEKDSYKSPDALQSDEDSATDEDDLIINMEMKTNKTALIGNQELERILENKESWLNITKIAKEEPNKSMPQVEKRNNSNLNKNKKRKSIPALEMESNAETTPGGKGNMQNKVGSGDPEDVFGELTKVSWSQKSSWKELLGGGGNTSFSASLILPKLDSSKNLQTSDDLCAPLSTNNKTENMERDRELWSRPTNTQVIKDQTEAQPTNTQVIKDHTAAQPTNKQVIKDVTENQHDVAPNKTGRGASWLQKQSWTQMVSENNNSFSISHILPGITFPEPKAKDPIVEPAISNYFKHNGVAKDTINNVVSDGFKSRETIQENSQYIGANDIAFAPVVEEKVETSPREKSTENIEIGETCSFMRSAASMKEWAKAKAAVSGSLKRKSGEK